MRISDWSSDVCSSDLEDADRPVDLPLQGADCPVHAGVILVRAVAEVQAEGVRARQEQAFQRVRRRAGRSDGGDDLRTAVTTHGAPADRKSTRLNSSH